MSSVKSSTSSASSFDNESLNLDALEANKYPNNTAPVEKTFGYYRCENKAVTTLRGTILNDL